ncbi:hypothetical protein PK28_13405 [Hymenobacter sp. DG25B]|jgi:hypothetical protein|uniref:hypothetical protein n=1 Tax=Hymenobacter sp. DG25B TaxID=1385664 RepID=UPI000540ABF8|nr:hypothetical protein [Hymenobacter sp. DG25B]AIZ64424.1 hypothetical protein PK28_13405 [Hymenobacter sp. DG25B]
MQNNPQPTDSAQPEKPQDSAKPNAGQPTEGQALPTSTQEDMGDGEGIRGGYGNSDQTNGMEGGEDPQPHNDLTRRGVGD